MWPRQFPDKRKGPILNESSVMAAPNNLRSVVEKPHLLGVNRQISNQPRGITRVSTQSSLFHLLLSHVLRNLHPQFARSFFRKPTDPLRCGLELYLQQRDLSSNEPNLHLC